MSKQKAVKNLEVILALLKPILLDREGTTLSFLWARLKQMLHFK